MALNPNLTSTGGFENAIQIFYDRMLLDRLESDLFFDQFGMKKTLPKNEGNQIKWTRYTNFAANTTPLVEGTIPNGLTLASAQILATPLQFGDYVTLSDLLETEAIDPVVKGALEVLGYRAALSLDTIIRNNLEGNVTDIYAGGVAAENLVLDGSVLNASEARKVRRQLKREDVRPMKGGDYAAIIHPDSEFDMLSDSGNGGFIEVTKYTSRDPLLKGEIGRLWGIRFSVSANIEIAAAASQSGADIYRNFFFGMGAYGVVDLATQNLKTFVKNRGSSGVADPIDQLSTVGYKFSHVTPILDANRAVEHHSVTNS